MSEDKRIENLEYKCKELENEIGMLKAKFLMAISAFLGITGVLLVLIFR